MPEPGHNGHPLGRLRARADALLWDSAPQDRGRALTLRAARTVAAIVDDVRAGRLTLYAMSLVYTTLLSLVPLLAVSFSVLKAFDVHYQAAPLLEGFLEPLGPQSAEITRRILDFVENIRGGVLGSLGVAMLFYTVVSLLQKVEGAFNSIWRVGRSRRFARRFSDYLSVLIVGPVLVFSAIGLTATVLSHTLVQRAMAIEPLGTLIVAGTRALPYVLVMGAFAFAYVFLTNTRVRVVPALIGAAVAGVLWQTTGLVFGTFVAGSARYAAVYSSFAILVLFMVWLYLSWLILLLGSAVAFYVQNPHLTRPGAGTARVGHRAREQAGLALLALVARAHLRGEPPPGAAAAARALGVAPELVGELVDDLGDARLIATAADPAQALLPARDPARISVIETLDVLREGQHDPPPGSGAAGAVLDELRDAGARALAGRTIRDLALADASATAPPPDPPATPS